MITIDALTPLMSKVDITMDLDGDGEPDVKLQLPQSVLSRLKLWLVGIATAIVGFVTQR